MTAFGLNTNHRTSFCAPGPNHSISPAHLTIHSPYQCPHSTPTSSLRSYNSQNPRVKGINSAIIGFKRSVSRHQSTPQLPTYATSRQHNQRVKAFEKAATVSPIPRFQLEWMVSVCQYVEHISQYATEGKAPTTPPHTVPILGPKFLPPSIDSPFLASDTKPVAPEVYYRKALTVIHPLYHPSLRQCPVCKKEGVTSTKLTAEGWATGGPRHVHGIADEEYAIGYVLSCARCQGIRNEQNQANTIPAKDRRPAKFTLSNAEFWAGKSFWERPRKAFQSSAMLLTNDRYTLIDSLPFVSKRSAITPELADLIMEFRIDNPAANIEEHVKRKFGVQ